MGTDKRKRRKIALVVLAICVVMTILRETGLLNLNWYHSDIQSTTLTNWVDQGFSYEASKDTFNDTLLVDSCDYGALRNVPVEVWCGDYIVGDTGICQRASVFIDDINYGWLYSPLYKTTHFSATVNCTSPLRFFQEHDSTVTVEGVNLSGNISVEGTVTIWGFMSARSARQEIKEHVCQEVYKQVVAHLQIAK